MNVDGAQDKGKGKSAQGKGKDKKGVGKKQCTCNRCGHTWSAG